MKLSTLIVLLTFLSWEAAANDVATKNSNMIADHLAHKNFSELRQSVETHSKGIITGIDRLAFQAKSMLRNVENGQSELLHHNVHIKSRHETIFHVIKFDKLAIFTKMGFVKGILTSFEFDSDPIFLLGQLNWHIVKSTASENDEITDRIERKAAKANTLYDFSKKLLDSMHINIDGSTSSNLVPFSIINIVELERKYHIGPIERRFYQIEAVDDQKKQYLLYACYLDFYRATKVENLINRVKCDAIYSE